MTAGVLSLDDLVAALASDAPPVLLDVRELAESEQGNMPGATILPRRRIEFRIQSLVRDRDTPLVAIDGGAEIEPGVRDPRARLAAATLAALGYRRVAALDAGVAGWRGSGLRLVPGAQVSSTAFGRRVGDLGRVPTIPVDTLRRWQAEGRRVALCDVRGAGEHTEGCVPGAVSVPGFEMVSHALDMAAESDVIVLCSSASTRSMVVARTLIDLGLGDVVALDGGTLAWRLAGHELEVGSRRRRVPPSTPGRQFAALGAARLAKHHGVGEIEADELSGLLQAARGNFGVFDLRDPGQHVEAHVPHSVAVACDRLLVRHAELIAVPDAPVMLVDDDDVRALLAGVWLRRLGLRDVRRLAGGFAAWTRAGHPACTLAEPPLGWREATAAAPGLDADAAACWLAARAPARVLHVDTGASYGRGHLPGAAWVPRGWLETRIGTVAPSPAAPLLVTCRDGAQAAFAAATLCRSGYAQVAWLQGGTRAWARAGLGLEAAAAASPEDELLPPARRDAGAMREYLARERRLEPRLQDQ